MNKPLTEFVIIDDYFKSNIVNRDDVLLGIGDDAALLKVPADQLLAVSVDTLVEGVHFSVNTLPADIGYKSVAVNLSDLAAMGATPAWMTLALTMPKADENWLREFARGFFEIAKSYNVQLVGGDTTHGPLTISVQVNGFVPPRQALCRHNAKPGDKIFVSGALGDAGLGLQVLLGKRDLPKEAASYVLQRLHRPQPQIKLGLLLRGVATSAIDISDGLLGDLDHILTASHVGAEISTTAIPMSDVLRLHMSHEEALKLALTAGDDYQLCFTVPAESENELLVQLNRENITCHCIGVITQQSGIKLLDCSMQFSQPGFLHF